MDSAVFTATGAKQKDCRCPYFYNCNKFINLTKLTLLVCQVFINSLITEPDLDMLGMLILLKG